MPSFLSLTAFPTFRAPDAPVMPIPIRERSAPKFLTTAEPIRVAFIVHKMQVAGAEMLIAAMIEQLGTAIEPTVLCLDAIGPLGERLQAKGIAVISLDRKPGRDWRVSLRMAKVLAERRVQVVHAHQYTPFFYAAGAKLKYPCKLILTEHGRHYPDIVSPLRRAVNRILLDRFADAVNAVCAFSGTALSRNDGFRGNRIDVIENGVDLAAYSRTESQADVRKRLGWPVDRKLVGMVARFHPVKDHAMLLRAFAQVAQARPDTDLYLAGDGELRATLEAQAESLGIAERVRFLGVRRDVPDVLHALDVFTLTSVSEAASLTLLEAMASGLPSVVTDVGGNPEIIREGVDGFRVPRGDANACAAAILRALANPEPMGSMARERVRERFTLDRTISTYHKLYRRLIGRSDVV